MGGFTWMRPLELGDENCERGALPAFGEPKRCPLFPLDANPRLDPLELGAVALCCPPGEPKRRHPPLELPPPAGALPPVIPREGDPLGEVAIPRCAFDPFAPLDGLPN
jgi:hypothetical protein